MLKTMMMMMMMMTTMMMMMMIMTIMIPMNLPPTIPSTTPNTTITGATVLGENKHASHVHHSVHAPGCPLGEQEGCYIVVILWTADINCPGSAHHCGSLRTPPPIYAIQSKFIVAVVSRQAHPHRCQRAPLPIGPPQRQVRPHRCRQRAPPPIGPPQALN